MDKTLSTITTNLTDLLDEIVMEAEGNLDADVAAEEWADDNGWTVADEDEEPSEAPTEEEARTAVMTAYKDGRAAAFDSLREAVEAAKE